MATPATPNVICIGSALWDIIGRSPIQMPHGADKPGRIDRLPGGVALNIAITLRRLGMVPTLLTAIGRDTDGDELIAVCGRLGLDTNFVHRSPEFPTDRYLAIEDVNGLVAAIADAHSLEAAGDRILVPLADGRLGRSSEPWSGVIALDGNLTAALLADIAHSPLFAEADLRVAPASPGKAERLRPLLAHPRATHYVNLEEAGLLVEKHFSTAVEAAKELLAAGASRVLVTDGSRECCDGKSGEELLRARPPAVAQQRVTGAGDTFMAAHLAAEFRGASRQTALELALAAAGAHVSGERG